MRHVIHIVVKSAIERVNVCRVDDRLASVVPRCGLLEHDQDLIARSEIVVVAKDVGLLFIVAPGRASNFRSEIRAALILPLV